MEKTDDLPAGPMLYPGRAPGQYGREARDQSKPYCGLPGQDRESPQVYKLRFAQENTVCQQRVRIQHLCPEEIGVGT